MSSVVISGDTSGAITLAAPAVAGTNTLSLPAVTDTLVGLAATQTLTNKSIAATQLTGTIAAARLPTGSVLQVVSTTKTDTASGSNLMSSGSWANVLQVSITPTSSSSKILIIYDIEFGGTLTGGEAAVVARLVRGSTAICIGDAAGTRNRVTNGTRYPSGRSDFYGTFSQNFLDSPATTSSTTYSVQLACRGVASNTWYCNRSSDDYDGTEGSRSASTITVMEIAA